VLNDKYKTDLAKRSFDFGIEAIKVCEGLSQKRSAQIVANQLIRSATSVGANIVEARASSTRKEFKKFNEIALRSANESQYWIKVLGELGLIKGEILDKL